MLSEGVKTGGGEVIGEELFDYPLDPAVARSVILKHKSKGIDTFFTTGGPADIAAAMKVFQTLKLKPKVLSTQDLSDAVALSLIKQTDVPTNSYVIRLKVDPGFAAVYRKKHSKEPFLYSDRGYQALKILYGAAEATDGTADKVAAYINATEQFDDNGDEIHGEYEVVKLFP